jgi:NAD(P)-dependent dehydrogenase (short-subunit alcohol dehydrogenase family)
VKTKKIETALIVGGGSGMGRAAAEILGRAGIRILVADLNLAEANQTARALREAKGEAESFSVDVSSSPSVSALFEKLRETAGRLDLLVHTAAILGRTVPVEDLPDEEWRRMMSVNLDGVF